MASRGELSSGDPGVDRRIPVAYELQWHGQSLVYRPGAGQLELWPPGRIPVWADERLPWPEVDIRPRALTLALHRQCHLGCQYCFAGPRSPGGAVLSPALVRRAARLVAENCRSFGLPLELGFHGDNEPLLHPPRVEEQIAVVREVAVEIGVELRLSVTTSGFIPVETAHWAAATFDRLTLSHDGPFQDQQRPTLAGGPSGPVLTRTWAILGTAPRRGDLLIRATITRLNQARQVEMVEYFLDHGVVDRLLFHPVYPSPHWRHDPGLGVDPESFVRHFLRARRRARELGVELAYGGSRLGEAHGRHCPLLQGRLLLTPEGRASACFLVLAADSPWARQRLYVPGEADALGQRLSRIAHQCRSCFNLRHCEQGCPQHCPLELAPETPFDCRIPFWLGFAQILEQAGFELEDADLEQLGQRFPKPPGMRAP